ncbi:PPM1B, partial [Symbiodinium natans]
MPLPAPVTATAVERSAGQMGRAAVAAMQGLRPSFEDSHVLDQSLGICGVFDGHLGDEAAAFCAERLPHHISTADDDEGLLQAFVACDAELRHALPKGCEAGTTATVAKIQQNGSDVLHLLVASCGDSRALLWRKSSDTIECTRDHRPGDKSERERIVAAGGEVNDDFDPPRIDGTLACSRALGDYGFKQGPGAATEQKVTCMPEVYHWTAQRGDWLILACDGIWDTLSNEQVVQHVCKASKDLGDTVAGVLRLCIDKEADDNLTLVAVELGSVPLSEPSTTVSAGDFLKAKDPAVLDQYASFCLRFGFAIRREMQPKAPPKAVLTSTERAPAVPRFAKNGGYSAAPAANGRLVNEPAPPAAHTPLVVVGPSGVGKGTLIQKIMDTFPGQFGFAVSHTTRKPRPGEVHGKSYWFVELEEMKKEVATPGRFLEHASVHGNLYGTSQAALDTVRDKGQICILDVDVQGARLIKEVHSEFNY